VLEASCFEFSVTVKVMVFFMEQIMLPSMKMVVSCVPLAAVVVRGSEYYVVERGQSKLSIDQVIQPNPTIPNLLVQAKELRFFLQKPNFPDDVRLRSPQNVSTDAVKQFCRDMWRYAAEEVWLYPVGQAHIYGASPTDTVVVVSGTTREEMTLARLKNDFLPFEIIGSTPHHVTW
jgi:hypothetical protein